MRTVARNFPHCSLSPSFFFHVAQKIFSAERPSCLPRRRLGEASAGRQVVRGRRAGRKAGRERARGRSTERVAVGTWDPCGRLGASLYTSTRDRSLLQLVLLLCVSVLGSVPPSPQTTPSSPATCTPSAVLVHPQVHQNQPSSPRVRHRTFPPVPTFSLLPSQSADHRYKNPLRLPIPTKATFLCHRTACIAKRTHELLLPDPSSPLASS